MLSRITIFVFIFGTLSSVGGAEFEGVAKLFERLEEAVRVKSEMAGNPHAVLKGKIARYRAAAPQMSAEAQADGWLDLADDFTGIPGDSSAELNDSERVIWKHLLKVLPASPTWEMMAEKIARRDASTEKVALQLMMQMLRGSPDDTGRTLDLVRTALQKDSQSEEDIKSLIEGLEPALEWRMGRIVKAGPTLVNSLVVAEKEGRDSYLQLSADDLKGPDGDDILRRAIQSGAVLDSMEDSVLGRMKDLILREPSLCKVAPWELVRSWRDVPLYEALKGRFPVPERDPHSDDTCVDLSDHSAFEFGNTLYLGSLPSLGRADEARKRLAEYLEKGEGDVGFLFNFLDMDAARGRETVKFLEEILSVAPCLFAWEAYSDLSCRLGLKAGSLAFMKKAAASPEIGKGGRDSLNYFLFLRLVAADETDAAVDLLRKRIRWADSIEQGSIADNEVRLAQQQLQAAGIGVSIEAVRKMMLKRSAWEAGWAGSLPLELVSMGRKWNRQEWVAEGLAAALVEEKKAKSKYLSAEIDEILTQNGRAAEVERRYAERLEMLVCAEPRNPYEIAGLLRNFVDLYRRCGRWQDILGLLDLCPYWGATDLDDLKPGGVHIELYLAVAQALLETGDREKAVAILERCLEKLPDDERVYPLLMRAGGAELGTRLDSIAKNYPFTETPLIYKAMVQLRAGHVEAAEATIRKAVAMAPSKIHAQAVLADILEKKGDTSGAVIARARVAGQKSSAQAEELSKDGMTEAAIVMFQKALEFSPDILTAHLELSRIFRDQGDHANAGDHLVRAVGLLPEQWDLADRSNPFASKLSSPKEELEVMDRVLSRMAVDQPGDAKVSYVLGKTKEWSDQENAAAVAYWRAVEFDPDFAEAWSGLDRTPPPKIAKEADAIIFNLIRLGRYDPDELLSDKNTVASDLGKLWDLLLEREAATPVLAAGPLYPLSKSKPLENYPAQYETKDERSKFLIHPSVVMLMRVMGELTDRE